jgi:hypothetical protein
LGEGGPHDIQAMRDIMMLAHGLLEPTDHAISETTLVSGRLAGCSMTH